MNTLGLICFFATILGAYGSCSFTFSDELKQCGELHGFTDEQVFHHYHHGYTSEEAPKFNLFVECAWDKWGFLLPGNKIDYDAIRSNKVSDFLVTGVCNDVLKVRETHPFLDAVNTCETTAPADIRAETIRFCITKHFKENISK
uniref:Uncharacterized protein n=1 Tax=Photinus pyralis TaxID=7054 RepID=A0A1Y1KLF3_PHOPY